MLRLNQTLPQQTSSLDYFDSHFLRIDTERARAQAEIAKLAAEVACLRVRAAQADFNREQRREWTTLLSRRELN